MKKTDPQLNNLSKGPGTFTGILALTCLNQSYNYCLDIFADR